MTGRRKRLRNFRNYATMEALNVVLVPAIALYLGWPSSAAEAVAMVLAILPTSGLLLVGTVYWNAVDRRLKGDRRPLERACAMAHRAERPLLALIVAAAIATVAAFAMRGWSATVIAALVLTLLAVLEYVNYYKVQLQHFDNLADLRRLFTGRFRRSHFARDLAAYRRTAG